MTNKYNFQYCLPIENTGAATDTVMLAWVTTWAQQITEPAENTVASTHGWKTFHGDCLLLLQQAEGNSAVSSTLLAGKLQKV